jgi:AsmA protein
MFSLVAAKLDVNTLASVFTRAIKTPQQAPDVPAAASATTLPNTEQEPTVCCLPGLRAAGTLHIEELALRGLTAKAVSASLKLDQDQVALSALRADLYGGKLDGALTLDLAPDNKLVSKATLVGVDIQPLLVDLVQYPALSGTGNLTLDVNTTGLRLEAMKNSLNGKVQLQLRDGAIQGINLASTLRDLSKTLRSTADNEVLADDASHSTPFTEFMTNVVFTKGVGTVQDLLLLSPALRLSQGSPALIDLVKGELNLVTKVRIRNIASEPGDKNWNFLKGLNIPVRVQGPFGKLNYTVQWKEIAAETLKLRLENRLKGVLDKGSGSKGFDVLLEKLLQGLGTK